METICLCLACTWCGHGSVGGEEEGVCWRAPRGRLVAARGAGQRGVQVLLQQLRPAHARQLRGLRRRARRVHRHRPAHHRYHQHHHLHLEYYSPVQLVGRYQGSVVQRTYANNVVTRVKRCLFSPIVKLREREGQGVDPGRSLKGHLWMVDGGWWYTFP